MKQRLAIVGGGRLGQACADALHHCDDLVLAGIVRRAERLVASPESPVRGAACVSHIGELLAIAARLLAPHERGAWRYTPFGLVPWA